MPISRDIVSVYIGARDEAGAQGLWDSLPPSYRQCAVVYTDFWAAYTTVLPNTRHRAVGKETGKNSYIELANTLLLFEKQERTRRLNNLEIEKLTSPTNFILFARRISELLSPY